MEKGETIQKARELRDNDQLEESLELLLSMLENFEEDPVVLFEVGGAYDVLGMAPEAIPYYEEAIVNGLDGPELEECYVCLGTSHRVIGDFSESIEILEEALDRFPESNTAKAFLALSYYGNKQYAKSVQSLMEIILETTDDEEVQSYADSLEYLKDNLDEIWPD